MLALDACCWAAYRRQPTTRGRRRRRHMHTHTDAPSSYLWAAPLPPRDPSVAPRTHWHWLQGLMGRVGFGGRGNGGNIACLRFPGPWVRAQKRGFGTRCPSRRVRCLCYRCAFTGAAALVPVQSGEGAGRNSKRIAEASMFLFVFGGSQGRGQLPGRGGTAYCLHLFGAFVLGSLRLPCCKCMHSATACKVGLPSMGQRKCTASTQLAQWAFRGSARANGRLWAPRRFAVNFIAGIAFL